MGIIKDTAASFARYRGYGNEMKSLLSRHQVHSIDDLNRVARDSPFRSEVNSLWGNVVRAEGGVISLTILLSTIAIAMGGVGIAAGGGAIGVPLLAILAPAGYFTGQKIDSEGYTKAVVHKFEELLRMVQRLDSEQYDEMVAEKFQKLSAKIQELEVERHKFTERVVGIFNRLRGKTQRASS